MATDKKSNIPFDKDHSSKYDGQWAKLSPVSDALHLLTRVVLSELPDDAHILSVGAGTGAEIFGLAHHYPGWRFTAVDPSEPMLEICRRKAQEQGIASRCTFHVGYLSSLATSEKFDAATCVLVSHFLTDRNERQALFEEIGARLVPNGLLVNAELSSDMTSPEYDSLLPVWLRMMRNAAGLPADQVEKMGSSLGVDVAVLPPKDIETIIKSSGFSTPTLMFQSLLIHAWYSQLAAS